MTTLPCSSAFEYISLTTDFGTKDGYVASMKGVIFQIVKRAPILDISHEIEPQDIRSGSLVLMAALPYLPAGGIHVFVIDPEVGPTRKILCAIGSRGAILAPDNGALGWLRRAFPVEHVYSVENESLFWGKSHTFHGRDRFAPVAAHLLNGLETQNLGSKCEQWSNLKWPDVQKTSEKIQGQILYFDHFGNAITNIPADFLNSGAKVHTRAHAWTFQSHYAAVQEGARLSYIGSTNYLELAIRNGNAEQFCDLKRGDIVEIVCEVTP